MKNRRQFLKRLLIGLLGISVLAAVSVSCYMRKAKFGQLPEGERLARIQKSPNYRGGQFRNRVEKPVITKGYSMLGEGWKMLTQRPPDTEPEDSLPSIKTNLKALPAGSNLLVWFGHSSFLLQLNGKRFLADPVFSGNASPIPGSVKAYVGSDIYSISDFPVIDYILISHDHYDHLDYETMLGLKSKVGKVVCGLGVGAHLQHWGYAPEQIVELDWGDSMQVDSGFQIHVESSHHASGRGFTLGKSLWVSFLIQAPAMKVYYSGDGGHDDRFKQIRHKYGAVDWAIMENGQYNVAWESVHQLPHQMIESVTQLGARNLMTVHNCKFTLAKHPWYEPLDKAYAHSKGKPWKLATPLIGQVVWLNRSGQVFRPWWKWVR